MWDDYILLDYRYIYVLILLVLAVYDHLLALDTLPILDRGWLAVIWGEALARMILFFFSTSSSFSQRVSEFTYQFLSRRVVVC